MADQHSLFEYLKDSTDAPNYDDLLRQLSDRIPWQEDYFVAFDRKFLIPRKQAWFADDGLAYRYADNLLASQEWLPELLALRHWLESHTRYSFNAVLATLYRNGLDSVDWHADDERELGEDPVIASLSLGATRQFEFKAKDDEAIHSIDLAHGEWVIMPAGFQQHWQHRIPAQPEVLTPRINLTFRYVIR